MDIVRNISNFVFGMECLGCGSASERLDPWLCPACRAELEREAKEPSFPGADAMCLFPMRPLTRRLVHALKYRSLPGMAAYLVGRSSAVGRGEVAARMGMFAKPFYFVPVPLHPSRFRERGYNQAERIAMALAARLGGRVCRWLSRSSFKGVADEALARGAGVERGGGVRAAAPFPDAEVRDRLCRGRCLHDRGDDDVVPCRLRERISAGCESVYPALR